MKSFIVSTIVTLFLGNAAYASVLEAKNLYAQDAELQKLVSATALTEGHQISCESNINGKDRQIGFVERVDTQCGYGKNVSFKGAGLGLRFSGVTYFEISCLADSDPDGEYYGVKAAASVVGGLDVGVFANAKGVCFVIGGEVGAFGAGISGIKMTMTGFGKNNE